MTGPGGSQGERVAGDNLQEGVGEEARRVIAPSRVDRVDRVLHAPREDRAIVDHDDEADEGLEPADEFAAAQDLAQRPRRGAAELVSDCVVEPEHGNTDEDQCDQVRNQEGAAAVGVGDSGETPDVAQADGRADGRQ